MDVSIVLVSYNTCDLTLNCIRSIYERTSGILFEIILVDNASVDNTIGEVAANFSDVKIVQSGSNLGFGRANNLGVQKANGNYVFLLNTDTLLVNNVLNSLFNLLESGSLNKPGVVGGLIFDEKGNQIHSAGSFSYIPFRYLFVKYFKLIYKAYNTFLRKVLHKNREIIKFHGDLVVEVDYITGANMFMSKRVYNEVGGFDPKYFLYGEETDLQKRLSLSGYKNYITKTAEIIHLVGGSQNESNRTRIFKAVSYQYFVQRFYRKWFGVFRVLLILHANLSYFFSLIKADEKSKLENQQYRIAVTNRNYLLNE